MNLTEVFVGRRGESKNKLTEKQVICAMLKNRTPGLQRLQKKSLALLSTRRYTAAHFALCITVLLGLYLRLHPVLSTDFPLNDGALFYLMSDELRNNGYALPAFTSYNAAHIPFAYPPLGFYLAAAIAGVTGWGLIDVVHVLPAVISTLTIPAFYTLARALLCSRRRALFATLFFALLPYAYEWFIMGGGLARAPGLLFSILTIRQMHLLLTRRELRSVASTALCAVLTALSHPPAAWAATLACGLLLLSSGRDSVNLRHALLVAGAAVTLTSPWWATLLLQHGETLLSVASSGQMRGVIGDVLLGFSIVPGPLPRWPYLVAVGVIAAATWFTGKRYLLPLWLFALLFLYPHGAAGHLSIPLALLIGISLDLVLLSRPRFLPVAVLIGILIGVLIAAIVEDNMQLQWRTGFMALALAATASVALSRFVPVRWILRNRISVLHLYFGAVGCALVAATMYLALPPRLRSLSTGERAAMHWAALQTPEHSTFLVLPTGGWVDDPRTEWFPVLANRLSVTTVQGYEWLPHSQFFVRQNNFSRLRSCAGKDAACLREWGRSNKVTWQYVYVPHEVLRPERGVPETHMWQLMKDSLLVSGDYELIYESPFAAILRKL